MTSPNKIIRERQNEREYIKLDEIDEIDKNAMIRKLVTFGATVIEKKEERVNLNIVTVKQKDGLAHEVYFWSEKQQFQETLKSLKRGKYCHFEGVQIRSGGKLTASIFSRIAIYKT